jgi:hypothetical protein
MAPIAFIGKAKTAERKRSTKKDVIDLLDRNNKPEDRNSC